MVQFQKISMRGVEAPSFSHSNLKLRNEEEVFSGRIPLWGGPLCAPNRWCESLMWNNHITAIRASIGTHKDTVVGEINEIRASLSFNSLNSMVSMPNTTEFDSGPKNE